MEGVEGEWKVRKVRKEWKQSERVTPVFWFGAMKGVGHVAKRDGKCSKGGSIM